MELMLFGSITWFWIIFSVFIFWEIICATQDWLGRSTIALLIFLALVQFFSNLSPLKFIGENPGYSILIAIGYLVAGTAWSMLRWWIFVKKCRIHYEEKKEEFLKDKNIQGNQIPEKLLNEWQERCRLSRSYYERKLEVRPVASEYKKRIAAWIAYWPFSIFWYFLGDLLKDLGEAIFRKLKKIYQEISDSAWKGTEEELAPRRIIRPGEED